MSDASRYLLLDRIAVGGMAQVYRAKSVGIAGFEKIVAIKRVLPALAEDEEFVEMFIEEAKIAGQLQHANIAAIYELGKLDHMHFIAMEYVFGKNVRQILDAQRKVGGTLPPSLAAWIASQVLAGLDYAHRRRDAHGRPLGIIHRDVSPPNVIISYEGLVKLVDFGIAKAASRATQTVAGVIKGKLAYMSPEQLMGEPLDHRSDVFAASAVLYELLTSRRLFEGDNDLEVAQKVRDADASPPSLINPEIGPELDAVVMRGLARDREARWPTAGEMQEALIAAVARPGARMGTPALKEWMQATFARDYARDRARLERLSAVSQPGVELDLEQPTPDTTEFGEEATRVSAPPEELLRASQPEPVELSSLVMVEESYGAFERPDVSELEPSAPAPATSPSTPAPPSVSVEVDVEPAGPAPSPSTDRSGPFPPFGTEAPAAPPSQRPTQVASEHPPDPATRPPSVRFDTTQQPPEEPEEGGGVSWWVLALVAILALGVGVGGVVLFLFLTGRPLPFELPF